MEHVLEYIVYAVDHVSSMRQNIIHVYYLLIYFQFLASQASRWCSVLPSELGQIRPHL